MEISISTDIDLPKDEFVAYNENKGLLKQFLENGIFSDTGKTASKIGWSTPCPIYKLN